MQLFNEVTLQTPESVTLKFRLAGIGNRAYALLIDYILWSLMLVGISLVWYLVSVRLIELLEPILSDRFTDSLELWLVASYLLTIFAIYVGYFVFFEVWWQGQTPGKRWVNIRVIRDNGRPARLPQALLRALLRPIDDLVFLGLLVILFNHQEKRIGDWLAGTLVIQEERSGQAKRLQVPEAAQSLAQELLEQVNLERLSPENFAVIRTYLQRHDKMLPAARRTKSDELAQQLRERLDVPELALQSPSILVLQAVYWAYQQAYGDRL